MLINTKQMLSDALHGGYAIPAFNFYNLETLNAILNAAEQTHSPVILSVSESALKYMGDDFIKCVASHITNHESRIALHLDHGASFEICARAIDLGFTSVMIDASDKPFDENIAITKRITEYAHTYNVSVESELGILSGIEDDVNRAQNVYTNPDDVIRFVNVTGCDSLAIAIGTSHGAYKRKSETEELRFDILDEIAHHLPEFPLVLHGASTIPENLIQIINANGGTIKNAHGIPVAQIRRAVKMNVCKVNIDSDGRLAFTAAIRKSLNDNPENFNPRKYLTAAMELMTDTYIDEIKKITNPKN